MYFRQQGPRERSACWSPAVGEGLMPERNGAQKSRDFVEVNEGYKIARARFEAERCLRCEDPVCIEGCPLQIPIPEFIHKIAAGDMQGAARSLRSANPLPSVFGRVCPQKSQCEEQCSLGTRFIPIAIGYLEKFVADWEMRQPPGEDPPKPTRPEKVAIIGSGPAGLVCAGELARLGHPVTIYEGLRAPGGVLRYGVPEFRLPSDVLDWEIEQLKRLGVEIVCKVIIGKTLALNDLFSKMGFSAVFVGTGAGSPQFLGIPGENLNGVYSTNEFLTRIHPTHANDLPDAGTPVMAGKRIAVIGAGNTAINTVRTALGAGAEHGLIVQGRSDKEMTDHVDEHQHAIEKGVEFHWLTNPIEILGDEKGRVTGLRCLRMTPGEPDDSGRARPVPIEGSEFMIPVDHVVVSIGNRPNPLLQTTKGLDTDKRGCLVVEDESAQTSLRHVFAGGDAVTGAASVVLAAGAGKSAAAAIHADISA